MQRSQPALIVNRRATGWRIKGRVGIAGRLAPPPDKSLSHRAVLLAGLAAGTSTLQGLSVGEDVQRTVAALVALGISIEPQPVLASGQQVWEVRGRGIRGLHPSRLPIQCGNSGTTMRLLGGILAAQPFGSILVGDASLMQRPMQRIATPLNHMGAGIETAGAGGRPPLHVGLTPGTHLQGRTHRLKVDSAQVRSAILLAGLFAQGPTIVHPASAARDHTERMLGSLGVHIQQRPDGTVLYPTQQQGWPAFRMTLPGDASSAAFFVALASAIPGAHLEVQSCSLNPGRIRYLDVLRRAGAKIEVHPGAPSLGEPQGSFHVRGRRLDRLQLQGSEVVACIDEIPALLVAAAVSGGAAEVRDATELRVKESDRIAGMTEILTRFGANVRTQRDGMTLSSGSVLCAARVESHGDHRLAMAAAMLASQAAGDSSVDNTDCVATSYPEFPTDFNRLLSASAS